MVSITALWLPILLSAVIVFVVSSIIHMALPIHKSDYRKLPDEDKVTDTLRSVGVTPGRVYVFPYCKMKEMKSPEVLTGATQMPGTEYRRIFHLAGVVAFIGYSLALIQDAIWKGETWGVTFKYVLDGLIYGLLTAGTFGWLWPKG